MLCGSLPTTPAVLCAPAVLCPTPSAVHDTATGGGGGAAGGGACCGAARSANRMSVTNWGRSSPRSVSARLERNPASASEAGGTGGGGANGSGGGGANGGGGGGARGDSLTTLAALAALAMLAALAALAARPDGRLQPVPPPCDAAPRATSQLWLAPWLTPSPSVGWLAA